ncbi:MAG TPA: Gfo/Idh/MocA family oxidoreductase [Candidatus Binatia bacterium]|nr:Gfo/Idh/MocA family oxidoreductase [Candidatus Binatia bacterium]
MFEPRSIIDDQAKETKPRPRLGFLGVGWIGRHRLKSIADARRAEIVGLADLNPGVVAAAALEVPGADARESLQQLLCMDLDGIVIATPTALHAEQAVAALDAKMAVFCQKPLGRNEEETRSVIDAAHRADRLLGVDMSYRFVQGVRAIKERIDAGAIGDVYAMDLKFHNAYGPDKPWYYDPKLSGGGCVIDLGIHLVDMALWTTGANVTGVSARLYAQGKSIRPEERRLEDYATARIDLDSGATANLACSWHLNAGADAVIAASFYGTKGGLAFRNVNGSFYDFIAEEFIGTERRTIAEPPDGWGGRAVVDWAAHLGESPAFDPAIESAAAVARVIDAIYQRSE